MKVFLATAALALCCSLPVQADSIERACNKSDRKAASRSLCGCIQDAADLVLSTKDQSLAAKFFGDPHKAQEIRQSDNRSHESFWKRYKEFGATAEAFCS